MSGMIMAGARKVNGIPASSNGGFRRRIDPREARIQSVGRRMLSNIPRTGASVFSGRGVQELLMRQTMSNKELAKAMFGLVAQSPDINSVEALKLARKAEFLDPEMEMPLLMRAGIRWMPALMFYPAYKLSVASMAKRFIAGNSVSEAVGNMLRMYRAQGVRATLDILGESVGTEKEARENVEFYVGLMGEVAHALSGTQIQPNFSTKLTGIYPEKGLIQANIKEIRSNLMLIYDAAIKYKAEVCLDKEFFSLLDLTLRTFMGIMLQPEYGCYPHFRLVQQLYYKDAEPIAKEIIEFAVRRKTMFNTRTSLRLVKGAYCESEARKAREGNYPNPICASKPLTDANFEYIVAMYLREMKQHDCFHLAIGSHNLRSVSTVIALAEEYGIPKELLEFQFLYGMEHPLFIPVQKLGYITRTYDPFTPDGDPRRGLPYFVRRLIENTDNASMFAALGDYQRGIVTADELLRNPLELI